MICIIKSYIVYIYTQRIPKARLLKSPLKVGAHTRVKAHGASNRFSLGWKTLPRRSFLPMMLTCKFPMWHWDCSFQRPFAKKKQPSEQFINCSGSEKGTCGPTNDGPLFKLSKSLEIIHFGFVATKSWSRSPRMGARHRNAKSLSRPYPMSRQCQPTTEDMTWKWLWELEYDLSNICENQDSDPHPWIHLFQLDTMALRVSSWHATVLRGCPNNWHFEGFGVPNAAARKHVATSQPCRLAKKTVIFRDPLSNPHKFVQNP
jgi:hypothetical protein